MLDLRKKIVPDKGTRNRQRPVTKALKFLSRKKRKKKRRKKKKKKKSQLCKMECTQRDKMTGTVAR